MRTLSLLGLARRAVHAARRPTVQLNWTELTQDAEVVETELGEAKWIHVCTAGNYKGHASGEFTFDESTFADLVRNVRNHPAFKLGPAGVGVAPVVPFDWKHNSEKSAEELGPNAIDQQVAQGWACDAQVRVIPVSTKDAAGRAVTETRPTLWVLACMLEPAKSYIQQGKIRWTSVAVWPNTPDTVTGESIGWYMSSIALTNDPFVQGMYAIAAERSAGAAREGVQLSVWVAPYDKPSTASELIEHLRRIFGLGELADLGAVLQQLATLRAAALGTMAPPAGVDITELVGALRSLFNLPTLADVAIVFGEVDKLVAALAQEQAAKTANDTKTIAATRAAQKEIDIMKEELLKLLAATFNVAATEEAVLAAMKRSRVGEIKLGRLLALAGNEAEDKGDEDKGDATKAMSKLQAAGKVFGSENIDDAIKKAQQMIADAKCMEEALPELSLALAEQADEEDKVAAEDVGEVMAAMGVERDERGALVLDASSADYANYLLHARAGGGVKFDAPPAKDAKAAVVLAWAKSTKATLASRKAARSAFLATHAELLSGGGAGVQVQNAHYLLGRIAAPSAPLAPAQALALGRGGQQPTFLARPNTDKLPENGAAKLPNIELAIGNRTERLLWAAEQAMGAEPWKKLSLEKRFEAKRNIEAQYTAAGVDLSRFNVVGPSA